MPDFQIRDPLLPAFWDERFAQQFTPWERGAVPQALRRFVAERAAPLTCLIPGCGAARELAFLLAAGWDAVAIDFSPVAVAAARAALAPGAQARVREADFFTYAPEPPPQLIYEQAFLCALPRVLWPQVAARWAALLAPGALLAGFFYFDGGLRGPPFGIARAQLDALLTPCFDCIVDEAVTDSIALFAGKERWMVWRRLP